MPATPTTLQDRTATLAGARESNAGDDFHVLWAMGQALQMLVQGSELAAVVMEGVSPRDEVAANQASLLGVDLTEYFGGSSFAEATTVRISQLKYSQRNPTERWTAARLATVGSRGQPGVVARLAELFKAHRTQHGRSLVLQKLRIRIVSNQPPHPDLVRLLNTAQVAISGRPTMRQATLSRHLTDRDHAAFGRLHSASKLNWQEFLDFLSVLSIEGLDAGSRAVQRTSVATAIGSHVLGDIAAPLNAVYVRFLKEALPEAEGSLGVTRADLLADLGARSERSIFPLPPRLVEVADPIPTQDVQALGDVVLGGNKHIVGHGVAGVGKTTTLGLLEGALPDGSVVVRYDCFGAGEYLGPAEARHSADPALVQLINMVSIKCGTPLLIGGGGTVELWQHWTRVLEEAAAGLGTSSHLVIAIDAADNATVAGQIRGEPTVIPDLWRIRLPDRVHLLMTARTHRAAMLEAPDDTISVTLTGFDEEASALNLRRRFAATDEQCCEFHSRSSGNPRTQFYVLDSTRPDGPTDASSAIAAAAATPDRIFQDLLTAATSEAQSPLKAKRHVADLICLTRSVTVQTFAYVIDVPVADAQRFIDGLSPGLTSDGEVLSFRDEDFETFVRRSVTDDEIVKAHRRIAKRLMPIRDRDEYAATACAEHLFHGGRERQLLELALAEPQPAVVVDPVARLHTYRRRIELAMKVAGDPASRRSAIPLVLRAASAAATDAAVRAVILKRPDLAVRFADSASVARVFESDATSQWRGVQHMRLAGLYAHAGDLDLAREQLELTDAWLRRRSELEPHERSGWDFDAEDLAGAYRAVYALDGPERVTASLGRWRPVKFTMDTAEALVRQLVSEGILDVRRDILDQELAPWAKVQLVACASQAGQACALGDVRALAEDALGRAHRSTADTQEVLAAFAELIATTTGDHHLTKRWLDAFPPSVPSHGPSSWSGLGSWKTLVRSLALRAAIDSSPLLAEDIVPPSWQDEDSWSADERKRLADDKRRLREALGAELPILVARARSIAGLGTHAELKAVVLEGSARIARRHHSDDKGRHTRWLLAATEATLARKGAIRPLVAQLVSAARELDGTGHSVTIRLAELSLRDPRTRPDALVWLEEVAGASRSTAEPASERIDRLLQLTRLVLSHDAAAAGTYYLAAVEAADDLDDEGSGVLRVQAALAQDCRGADPGDRRDCATRLAAAIERFQPRVSDDRYLRWDETLEAIAGLDSSVGFTTLTRWDANGHVHLQRYVTGLIWTACESRFLRPVEAAELLLLAGPDDFRSAVAVELLELALDARPRPTGSARRRILAAVDQLASYAAQEATPEERLRLSRQLSDWAEDRSLTSTALLEVKQLASWGGALPRDRRTASSRTTWTDRSTTTRRLLKRADSSSLKRFPNLLEQFLDAWPEPPQIVEFLTRAANARTADERLPFLEQLVALPPTNRLWGYQSTALLRCFADWKRRWRRRDIQSWFSDSLPRVLEARFNRLIPYDQSADDALLLIARETLVEESGGFVLRATGPVIESLSSGQLYAIARALGRAVSDSDRLHALQWSLACETPAPAPPIGWSRVEATAQLLWVLFGHPERRVRWSAAHAARQLLRHDPEVFDALIVNARTSDAGASLPEDCEFLWLSALQWTLVVIARLADEAPSSISPDTHQWLVSVGTSKELPHSSIRELARRSALLVHCVRRNLDDEVIEGLETIHQAKAVHIAKWHSVGTDRFTERPGERFRFNSMDTIPYWFEPLGRVFVLPGNQIAARVERWIVDGLGFTEETARAGRAAALGRYEYRDVSNDHGSQPRVEDLKTYLEYHGMLLAAGELLDEGIAIERDGWVEEGDAWQRWLEENLDSSPNRWVRDLRTAAPLEPWVYGHLQAAETWRSLADADFDAELDLRDGHIVVSGAIDAHGPDRWGTTWVSSALVSPATATALLRALQTAEDPSDFRLPEDRGPQYEDEMEIREPDFNLVGWIRENSREELGIEEHDPFRQVRSHVGLPGSWFQRTIGAKPDSSGCQLLDGSRVVSWQVSWDDQPRSDRDARAHSSGRRTYVDLEALTSFLTEAEHHLIIEVQLRRHYNRSGRELPTDDEEEDTYDRGRSRIYLLDGTGRLETMARGRQIGRRNRPPAGAGVVH
jgi:hypothetical protein